MIISTFKKFFTLELSNLYSESESSIIFSVFLENLFNITSLIQRKNDDLSENQQKKLLGILNELKTGKPYQQILGYTEFYGLKFYINEHVLIPRPETEELLELAIGKIQKSRNKNQDFKILDIGTGSGIIPIVLKKKFPNAVISAIDISENALQIAKKNAASNEVEINFYLHDYLTEKLFESYDIIISNPPYIGIDERNEIEKTVQNFEPILALFSPTSDPLIFYKKIAKDAQNYLAKNGLVFLEINQKLGAETLALFNVFSEKTLLKDLSGNDRFIFAKK